jgi:hypothetical protein
MIDILLAAALAWQFGTDHDPLGNPVYVAEVKADGVRSLRFLCGGMTGVVLQFNLGFETSPSEYAAGAFSAGEPPVENVRFAFVEGNYDTTARRAPITDGIGTYEIKGSDAAFIAGLMTDSESVEIHRGRVTFRFPLAGAKGAIEEARTACPYKYPE